MIREASRQSEIGSLLRGLRERRGLSLGAVSLRAGVSKSTLSRWESGIQQPGIPELESVLKALGCSPEDRLEVLQQLNAPRAVRHLRTMGAVNGSNVPSTSANVTIGEPPHIGDLLRALRLRRRETREQTAARLGVRPSTICRWERGESRPDREFLDNVCAVLMARAEEADLLRRALDGGGWAFSSADTPPSEEAIENRFRTRFAPLLLEAELHPGADLELLSLEASLWRHALRRESLRPALGEVYAYHANYLRNFGLVMEAGFYAQKALACMPCRGGMILPDWVQLAAVCAADAAIYQGRVPTPMRSVSILETWSQEQDITAFYRAWIHRKIAGALSMERRYTDALAALQQGDTIFLTDDVPEK